MNTKTETQPTFTVKPEVLLDFNNDCEKVTGKKIFKDIDILSNKVSIEMLFDYWYNNNKLRKEGYAEHLSLNSIELFSEYKKFITTLELWKCTKMKNTEEKPTFIKTPEELLEFNDDCCEAIDYCPNHHNYEFEDREILLKKVTAGEVLEAWSTNETLWNSGYSNELSGEALDMFSEYKKFKAKLEIWEQEHNE